MVVDANELSTLVISGMISDEDVHHARTLHRKGFFAWRIVAVFVGLLATMALGDTLRPDGDPEEFRMAWKFAAIAYGFLPFAFFYPILWHPPETAGCSIARTITRDGIYCQDGETNIFIPWELVVRSRSSDSTAVVYTRGTPGAFIFPRWMFASDRDWSCFRETLRGNTI